ncbi:RNA-dependent RNA polymerase 1 [Hordeum vulgare]|nr:RNA-dependent RNA polymerase 1 [Hordeum vulgare]
MCIPHITFCNVIALIETEGYGLNDYMYYVRKPGVGIYGLEEICDDEKVAAMLDHIASTEGKVVNLIVIRATHPRPTDLNSGYVYEEQVPLSEIGEKHVYEINNSGVLLRPPSKCSKHKQPESLQFYSTQQSTNNCMDLEAPMDEGNAAYQDELETLMDLKRRTKVEQKERVKEEERVEEEDRVEEEGIVEQEAPPKKKRSRKGPTKRSHSSLEQRFEDVWVPSSDEEIDTGVLKHEYDDRAEELPFVLPNGRKSRVKQPLARNWYSEDRENPEERFFDCK